MAFKFIHGDFVEAMMPFAWPHSTVNVQRTGKDEIAAFDLVRGDATLPFVADGYVVDGLRIRLHQDRPYQLLGTGIAVGDTFDSIFPIALTADENAIDGCECNKDDAGVRTETTSILMKTILFIAASVPLLVHDCLGSNKIQVFWQKQSPKN